MSEEQRDDKPHAETPRTDAALLAVNAARQLGEVDFIVSINDLADVARQLERELAIAKNRLLIELEAPTTIGTQSAVAPMTASDFRLMSESEKYGCYASAMRRIAQSASAALKLTKGELEALIDYHDFNDAGADAMGMTESAEYHSKRSKEYAAMRDKLNATDRKADHG